MRFAGHTVVVTGSASGIGLATATAFLREGARVIGIDRQASGVPSAESREMDVCDEVAWERALAGLERVDCLVVSAGISHATSAEEVALADWQRVFAVNVEGALLALKAATGKMQPGASVVFVGSASGRKPAPGAAAYCASKAALAMLARCAALELKPKGIRVNTIAPAGVVTPMWRTMDFFQKLVEEKGSEAAAWEALGGADPAKPALERMALPEEVAEAILFLCSPAAAHITGIELPFDAGYTL